MPARFDKKKPHQITYTMETGESRIVQGENTYDGSGTFIAINEDRKKALEIKEQEAREQERVRQDAADKAVKTVNLSDTSVGKRDGTQDLVPESTAELKPAARAPKGPKAQSNNVKNSK